MGFLSQLNGDFVFIRGALRSLRMTTHIAKNPDRTFPNVVEELAAKYGDAPALLSTRENFTYRQLFERSNRYFEGGYIINREILYRIGAPTFEPEDAYMIRGGVTF